MNKRENEIPIRIVKKKVHGHRHHGGSWKVAYADFVTAMLALFIVLWVLAAGDDVKQAVAGYFQDPSGYMDAVRKEGAGMLDGSERPILTPVIPEEMIRQAQQNRLIRMGHEILREIGSGPHAEIFLDQITFEIFEEGLRIELLETTESIFFDIGTAKLKPEAENVLRTIAQQIGKLPNKVILEGHTDSRQYSSIVGYTNYELSADRANSARRVLATNGLRDQQILEIRGYADTRLRNIDDPYDAANRRISIIITYNNNGENNGQQG
jgi:chemotaxis protein MotB